MPEAKTTAPIVLTDNIVMVGSGLLGAELSHPSDSNVFLVHEGAHAILIDSGCGLATDVIVPHVRMVTDAHVEAIIVTHAHADHAAGAASLAHALQTRVLATDHVATVLEAIDTAASGLEGARAAGLYPDEVSFVAVPTDRVDDGYELQVGTLRVRILVTPGHAAGHISLELTGDDAVSVFTGDLVFSRGRAALLDDSIETDLTAWEHSVARLASLQPDRMFPGHGSSVLARATQHLELALSRLQSGIEPEPLIDATQRPRRDRSDSAGPQADR